MGGCSRIDKDPCQFCHRLPDVDFNLCDNFNSSESKAPHERPKCGREAYTRADRLGLSIHVITAELHPARRRQLRNLPRAHFRTSLCPTLQSWSLRFPLPDQLATIREYMSLCAKASLLQFNTVSCQLATTAPTSSPLSPKRRRLPPRIQDGAFPPAAKGRIVHVDARITQSLHQRSMRLSSVGGLCTDTASSPCT